MLWDIFCKVIDNHGDTGVSWRLACQLARIGETVTLWLDDASALGWMAPQGEPGVTVRAWVAGRANGEPGDVVVEAFGCELDAGFVAAMAARNPAPSWVNLEYLTAEGFAERSHLLPSPVLAGPGKGLVKHFYYPGFTPRTGGILREPGLPEQQARFDKQAWRAVHGVKAGSLVVSLFCYEPPALPALLDELAAWPVPVQLLVTAGRAAAAVQALDWQARGNLAISFLPLMDQRQFDHLLWACDLNLVRGEDSLVRALLAGKPFVWNIYPQHDGAHRAKLDAFLQWLQAPPSLAQFHAAWNGSGGALPAPDPSAWATTAEAARTRLLAQPDLVSQLLEFIRQSKNR